MSCMESKMVLRVEIESLKGNSYDEAYPYYKSFLGEADEVEEWEGNVEFFTYEKSKHEFIPVLEYGEQRWGIDYILDYHYDGRRRNGKSAYTLSEIISATERICRTFNVSNDNVKLISYEWYNGGDEPVSF